MEAARKYGYSWKSTSIEMLGHVMRMYMSSGEQVLTSLNTKPLLFGDAITNVPKPQENFRICEYWMAPLADLTHGYERDEM